MSDSSTAPGPPSSERRTPEDELPGGRPTAGRVRAFRVIAVFMAVSAIAFGAFTAVFGIVSESQEIHAFHNVVVAALLLVLSAPPTIAAARAPERASAPLTHLVVLGVAGLVTMIAGLKLDLYTFPFVVFVAVLIALRVSRTPTFPPGRPSPALAIVIAVVAIPLFLYALDQAQLQRTDTASEHAEFNHWVETSFYALSVLLLGLLAAVRPAAYRLTAWCAGLALVILGGASFALSDYASALDAPWAAAALVGGAAFILISEWEIRR